MILRRQFFRDLWLFRGFILKLKHLGLIESQHGPFIAETFRQIQDELNLIATKTGTVGVPLAAPPNIRSIVVTALNGQFNITLSDPDGQAAPNLGIHYFLEWSTDPAFPPTTTTVEDIGPGRGESIQLGNLTLFWRAYSQYRNSQISQKITFGGITPTPVVGGGAAVPTPPAGGSGGDGGGGGFGGLNNRGRKFAE